MIIDSILDSDLYKFTMQQAVLHHYQGIPVTYGFINRNRDVKFTANLANELRQAIDEMAYLKLTCSEENWLTENCKFFNKGYLEFLHNYRFNPNQVVIKYDDINGMTVDVVGPWEQTILWEVPILAIISELYFKNNPIDISQQITRAENKSSFLKDMKVQFAEFGTRRRYSRQVQELVFQQLYGYSTERNPYCVGTSNVFLAFKYNTKPIGTQAHEWIMGVSALESLRHANRYAMSKWIETYHGSLGIALTDTFGTDSFFEDFNLYFAKLFDGVRHDSDDAIIFAEKMIAHYKKIGIDPKLKTIVFSDGLNLEEVVRIEKALGDRIQRSYGIGTFFTNDVPGSKALNIVMKLKTCNNIPVVKLSDSPTKAIGDKDALRVAQWTFNRKALDS